MILVDANLLIYAVDARSPLHATAKAWWSQQLSQPAPVCLSWLVLLAFVRITTNPPTVHSPLTFEQAAREIDSWFEQPCVLLVGPTATHWETFKRLLRAAGPGSGLVNDAHLAALALEHGCEVCSTDGDFAKFASIRWRNPLVQTSTAAGP